MDLKGSTEPERSELFSLDSERTLKFEYVVPQQRGENPETADSNAIQEDLRTEMSHTHVGMCSGHCSNAAMLFGEHSGRLGVQWEHPTEVKSVIEKICTLRRVRGEWPSHRI